MLKKVLLAYGPYKWKVLPIFGFLLTFEALDLLIPYLYSQVVDMAYGLSQNASTAESNNLIIVWKIVAYAALASIVRQTFSYCKDFYELWRIDYQLENHIQSGSLRKLFGLSIGQHKDKNSGIVESTITKGERALRLATEIVLFQLTPLILQIVITTTALIILDPLTGIVLAVGMAIHITISLTISYRFIPAITKSMDMDDNDSGRHKEIVGAMPVIIASAQERRIADEFATQLRQTASFKVGLWSKYMLWNVGRSFLSTLFRPLAVGIAIWQVYHGVYGPAHMVVVLMWAGHAIGNIGALPYFHRNLLNHWGSIKNYFTLLDLEPEVKEVENPLPFTSLKRGITLENVSFAYKSEIEARGLEANYALKGVNLFLPRGERIALVGKSGSGKSTLVDLLQRANDPTSGRILVDDNDLRELCIHDWRSRMGIVYQLVTLFDETLGKNITFALNGHAKEVTDERLEEVARLSRITAFYHRLTNGFQTKIGEDGIKLSGGERQRVGIARALIADPDILILDEATSSLDTENEAMIKRSIDEAAEGRTAISIAHRLSTVRDADMIVVMDEGQIVATGTHEELFKGCELYERLVRLQELH